MKNHEVFITKLSFLGSRNISDLDIQLSQKERKHLIITGKNGSGKTILLNELSEYLKLVRNDNKAYKKNKLFEKMSVGLSSWQKLDKRSKESFIFTYLRAKRGLNLDIPSGISKIDLKKNYSVDDNVSKYFIQYIVNLKADRSFARDDENYEQVKEIDEWFERFEGRLKKLFNSPSLVLKFNRKDYNFEIIEGDKEPFGFNTLSDGYSAIINIVAELLMRMEGHNSKAYDMQGIVLIDEVETHLHVELQKTVLPFLIDFFPKIQFIVTTHSPFVISSVKNAVVCDLETKVVTEDLSGYSYDALIESYFSSDKYSTEVKDKIKRFEELSKSREGDEIDEFYDLKEYFSSLPKYLSTELNVKLQQIELSNLNKQEE